MLASLGTQAEGEGDSHFRLVLGLPYTITINIPWDGHHHARLRDAGEGGRGVRVACGVVEQEVNAKTAIVGLSGSSSITLTQVPTQ